MFQDDDFPCLPQTRWRSQQRQQPDETSQIVTATIATQLQLHPLTSDDVIPQKLSQQSTTEDDRKQQQKQQQHQQKGKPTKPTTRKPMIPKPEMSKEQWVEQQKKLVEQQQKKQDQQRKYLDEQHKKQEKEHKLLVQHQK